MTIAIIIIVVIVLAAIFYLSSIKGEYEVKKSLTINAPAEQLFDYLIDLKRWQEWSPWLMHEPNCKLEYSEKPTEPDGHYSWDGKYIGAGKLTHMSLNRPNHIEEKIEFTRPFKSTGDVKFELSPKGEQTEVSWIMQSKMPFLFRFMIANIVNMVGKDYELGLALLAGKMDPTCEHPDIQFEGITQLDKQYVLCKGFSGYLTEMQQAMASGFPELMNYVQQQSIETTGSMMSIYHKTDVKKMHFVCDMAVPVTADAETGNYTLKELTGGKYFKVILKGDYRFLELCWYSAYVHLSMHKIKADKSRPALEIYETDAESVDSSNEIITVLYLPVK